VKCEGLMYEEADSVAVWLLLNLRRAGMLTEATEEKVLMSDSIEMRAPILFLRENPTFNCEEYHPPNADADAWNPPVRERGMYEGEVRVFHAPKGWWNDV